jgi:predicted component of type VI protein secretion system
MAAERDDAWNAYVASCNDLADRVRKSSAVNVNSKSLREAAQSTVQNYFRSARPHLLGLGIAEDDLSKLDGHLQTLNQLSNGKNAKASYIKELKSVKKIDAGIASKRELLMGIVGDSGKPGLEISTRDKKIIETLYRLVPSAALSFEQALLDRANKDRKSFRGTAAELREALREVIDHFAPDEDVVKAPASNWKRIVPNQQPDRRCVLSTSRALVGIGPERSASGRTAQRPLQFGARSNNDRRRSLFP